MGNIFTWTVDNDGIANLVWDDPDRPVNVINTDSTNALIEAVNTLAADDAVKGIVFSSPKRDFVAGADLQAFLKMGEDAVSIMAFAGEFHGALRTLETCGKPVAAAMTGSALGGGIETALACHYRVVADNPKIRIGFPEAKLGLLPGGGGTQRFPRMVGIQKALPFLLEAKIVDVHGALKAGFVEEIAPADTVFEQARKWCLENPGRQQPWDDKKFKLPGGVVQSPGNIQAFNVGQAMLRAKTYGNFKPQQNIMQAVYEGLQVPMDAGLKIERRYLTELMVSRETKAMIRTNFFGMQDANKLKARPKDIEKATFTKVAIIGAGMMGAGIAFATAKAGVDVVLRDVDQEAADKGKAYSEGLVAKLVKRGKMSEEKGQALLGRIKASNNAMDLAECELVIEAVTENAKTKGNIYLQSEVIMDHDAILATNTSTLPINQLAEATNNAQNFIGMHFFSPAETMPLVELIVGRATSDETLARSMDFVQLLRKTPIVVNDSRGFFTSRVFGTYIREGLAMLVEGVKPALIENAGKMAGMPIGPLALADEVSLELLNDVQLATLKALGDDMVIHPGDQVIGRMTEMEKRLGKKSGKGFYDYSADGEKRIWPGLKGVYPVKYEQPDVEEVKKRMIYAQSLETVRCMDEGVVRNPVDADIGSILGWGFAPFTGGVVSNIEVVGAETFVAECDALAEKFGERFEPTDSLREKAESGESYYAA
ncbi:MAG: 3-hydroxyacyl-CoA dehydrogenase NAD-binding domain-containing protein [Rhodospirillales bacterium]|nr:3-hydroxyacyl-CoA dehydrogenase NAD-binding domain-containing protein [Rhodospirillales bacterium]